MSEKKIIDLYELLPALYRIRDAEQGYKLRSLLEIISDQADILKRDTDGLWDDFFIETCREWVIPYIGDLVANNPIHEVAASRRADVAKTIYYRRRKGTLSMLEELARDVTGWGAHAVPFFELLGWTQNLNHLRYSVTIDPIQLKPIQDPIAMERVGSVNLRNRNALDLLNSPFDIISHAVDVRAISRSEGWYNIRKIGFFLWRLRSYSMNGVNPRKSSSYEYGFHFSPLGNPSPLFNKPDTELGEDGLCTEINIPEKIRPLSFYFNKEDYYSTDDAINSNKSKKSIAIYSGSDFNSAKLVAIDKVACKDLSDWGPPPQGMTAAIDLRLGRITFASDPGKLFVFYNYGFSADIGGGPYDRRNSLADPEKYEWEITVCKNVDTSNMTNKSPVSTMMSNNSSVSTLEQALNYWADPTDGNKRNAIITIADNSTYEEAVSSIEIPEGISLVIEAANQLRPHLRLVGNNNTLGILKIEGNAGSKLILNGLLIEGGIYLDEKVEDVTIEHCTLVPGLSLDEGGEPLHLETPSVSVHKDNSKLSIEIDQSITGPLNLPSEMACLTVKDSIIDACDDNRYAISFIEKVPHLTPIVPLPMESWGNLEVIDSPDNSYFVKYLSGILYDHSDKRSLEDGQYRKILMNSNEARQFGRSNEIANNLKLEEGYELSLKSIKDKAITLELTKNRQSVDTKTLLLEADSTLAQTTYYYSTDASGLKAESGKKIVIIAVHIQGVKSKDKVSIVDVDGVFQISDVPIPIIPALWAHLPGPSTKLERVTVFGLVHVKELTLASETIFTAPVVADRRQAGCVRFSYLPEGSKTPRRYRCLSDLALDKSAKDLGRNLTDAESDKIKEGLQPTFTSIHYGDPGYAQLSLVCAKEIRTGAEDGSEMGAFCSLKQPQRDDNLRIRLEEYLPFGLEAGFIYVT